MIHLVLGGARSGKSRFAVEQVIKLSEITNLPVTFIATATASDPEMAQRIAYHEAERPDHWRLAEVPLDLTLLLAEIELFPKQILLIDCLTLWLNNHLFEYPEQDYTILFSELLDALETSKCDIYLVSNEVGLGIIPMGEVSRQFVDQAGWLNQALAARVDKVTFIAAGLPMTLKGTST
jgi:adenosylcobinamide kinase/adenosylcobinamide-phosphate guanylyltransferase